MLLDIPLSRTTSSISTKWYSPQNHIKSEGFISVDVFVFPPWKVAVLHMMRWLCVREWVVPNVLDTDQCLLLPSGHLIYPPSTPSPHFEEISVEILSCFQQPPLYAWPSKPKSIFSRLKPVNKSSCLCDYFMTHWITAAKLEKLEWLQVKEGIKDHKPNAAYHYKERKLPVPSNCFKNWMTWSNTATHSSFGP